MRTMDQVKRRIITSMIAILLLIITLFGITYAYFISRVQGNTNDDENVSVSAGKLELTYGDGNGQIVAEKIQPGKVIETKTFTVTNTGTHLVESYEVIVENVYNDLKYYEDLTYTLTCKSYKTTDYEENGDTATETGTCSGSTGVFPQSDDYLVRNSIDVDITHSYELTLTYNETNKDQSDDMKKTISAKVNIIDDETNYKSILVYGNSIQDGTPSPTSPVEIESVGDSPNLFPYTDGRYNELNNIDFYAEDGVVTLEGETTSAAFADVISAITFERIANYPTYTTITEEHSILLEAGTYTFSADIENAVTGQSNGVHLIIGDVGQSVSGSTSGAIQISPGTTFILDEAKYCMPIYYKYKSSVTTLVSNIQLEKGDAATDYVPYGKYGIPVTISGRNLFPKVTTKTQNGVTLTIDDDGIISLNGTCTASANFIIYGTLNQGTYTLIDFAEGDFPDDEQARTQVWQENNVYIATKNNFDSTEIFSGTVKYTSSNIAFRIRIQEGFTYNNSKLKPMLVEGSYSTGEIKEFEPFKESTTTSIYLDEPLRKVGDCDTCADYIDLYNKKVYRNVEERVLNGTENWTAYGNGYAYYLDGDFNASSFDSIISNYFLTSGSGDDRPSIRFQQLTPTNRVYIFDDASNSLFGSLAGITSWLNSKNTNGNPLKIQYQLASTSPAENINVNIPKIDKNSIITVGTTVQPSKIETEY